MATATGFAGSDCTVTQYAYPDSVSAMHGLFAVMCALDHRRRSGQGQYINMSQYETLVSAIGHLVLEQIEGDGPALPCGNRARDRAPQGAYPVYGWLLQGILACGHSVRLRRQHWARTVKDALGLTF